MSITCSNCGSDKLKHSGSLMHGKKKMVKLLCLECETNTYIGQEVYESLIPTEIEDKQQKATNEDFEYVFGDFQKVVVSCEVIGHQVNEIFLQSLEAYCAYNGAKLLIIPIKYKNTNVTPIENSPAESYYISNNIEFGNEWKIMGALKLNASMEHPLSGLEPLSKGKSVLFGHPQVALKTVPTDGVYPSIITTTGCITDKFYTDTKQGLKANFNHSHSAAVLEIDSDGDTHLRHLNFDGQGFYDITNYYSPNSIDEYGEDMKISALVTGDEHVLFQDKTVVKATYTNDDSIAKTLNPELIVRHDVLDSYSVSHHHKKNVFTKFAKWKDGYGTVKDELDKTVDFILETTPIGSKSLIVSSNHNDHLKQWLNECDPTIEPWNSVLYHWFMWRILSETQMGESGAESPDPFELYLKEMYKADDFEFCSMMDFNSIEFIPRNEPYLVHDVAINHHGDRGQNGARGSRAQFSKLPSKTIIGHSHSPGIQQGCYQTGTSSKLKLEYNSGPSSWSHTHCVIYPNGKRQLIFIINGKWRS